MRVTVPSPALVTHRLPAGHREVLGRVADRIWSRAGPTRATASSPDSASHRPRPATTGLSGWRPTASGSPDRVPSSASKRCSVPARRVGDLHAAVGDRDAVRPAVGLHGRRLDLGLGFRLLGVAVAVASSRPAPRPRTNAATAVISASDSVSSKAGIVPLAPVRIGRRRVRPRPAASGLRSSRLGPTLPFVPARASV